MWMSTTLQNVVQLAGNAEPPRKRKRNEVVMDSTSTGVYYIAGIVVFSACV